MSRSIFFHLRKQINSALPNMFGGGSRPLQPTPNFNNTGIITVTSGDFDDLANQLEAVIGASYVIQRDAVNKTLTIKRVTDV